MVTGEDPFADDIDAGDPNSFADPAATTSRSRTSPTPSTCPRAPSSRRPPRSARSGSQAYAGVIDWIADNADERKIAYVAHTGDIIENNIRIPATRPCRQQVIGEFEVSSRPAGGSTPRASPTA